MSKYVVFQCEIHSIFYQMIFRTICYSATLTNLCCHCLEFLFFFFKKFDCHLRCLYDTELYNQPFSKCVKVHESQFQLNVIANEFNWTCFPDDFFYVIAYSNANLLQQLKKNPNYIIQNMKNMTWFAKNWTILKKKNIPFRLIKIVWIKLVRKK